jgi:hypothetical protein
MADDNEDNGGSSNNNQRSRSLGQIPITKLAKMAEFRNYQSCSADFSKAKQASAEAKEKMRNALRKGSPQLKDVEHLEFTVSHDGQSLNVFEKLRRNATRRRSAENEIQFK